MEYVYGPKYTSLITKDIEVSNLTYGRDGYFDCLTGKILINPSGKISFRDDLLVVHEAMHWFQVKVLHRRLSFTSNLGDYSFDIQSAPGFLGQEAEAEAARLLAIWYISSRYPWSPNHYPAVIAQDSKMNRIKLWEHLSKYQHLVPPYYWDKGLLDQ